MRKLYGIRDTKAQAIVGLLSLFPHDAVAVRWFGDVLADPQNFPSRHPEDYELCYYASLDETKEQVIGVNRTVIMTGAQWKMARDAANAAEVEKA